VVQELQVTLDTWHCLVTLNVWRDCCAIGTISLHCSGLADSCNVMKQPNSLLLPWQLFVWPIFVAGIDQCNICSMQ
jgi:hypothetical protein